MYQPQLAEADPSTNLSLNANARLDFVAWGHLLKLTMRGYMPSETLNRSGGKQSGLEEDGANRTQMYLHRSWCS